MIGVVGGGLAGLAAAYRLQGQGHEVRVFEAADDLGGLAASYETAGDPIEVFYHHLSASEQTIVELAEELGLGEADGRSQAGRRTESGGAVEWRIGKNGYYVDGVVHPMDTPWEIAAYPHLSLYDKFRLGMLVLDVDVRGGIPSLDTYERLEDFEDVPVEAFVRQHTTDGVYEQFFEPLLDAKFGSRKDDVSAAWLLGRIKFRGERDLLRGEILGYFEGGFHRLVSALVEAVGREHIVTGARVTDVGFDGGEGATDATGANEATVAGSEAAANGGPVASDRSTASGRRSVESLTVETDDGTGTYDVDEVVVATMPNVLEELTGYACEIDFQGTVCAVVSMPEELTGTYWLNVADESRFGALIEHTNFVPPERYGGEHLLYVASYVQDPGEDLWGMDDDEVREYWLEGIAELFPEFDPDSINWMEVARNPRTAPIYERGYLDMVVPYDLGDEVAEGVYYAGMASRAQYPERSLNGAIEAGYACADLIEDKR